VIGGMMWSAANFALSWGLALVVYVRLRFASRARAAFDAAELERIDASREVLVSRLEAMRARIEPQFLLGTLAHVEALYDRDQAAGDRMLEGLIDYLHAALPQLRRQRSTLKAEVDLAERYLRIVQIRMGSRLAFRIAVPPEVGDWEFPPMVLLPLVDDALRRGLEPLPAAGWIAITAIGDGDCLRVSIADNGLPPEARFGPEANIAVLQERLTGLYGDDARLIVAPGRPHGVVATIEVPLGHKRNHR
jgi:LytS/YehU family sensor histidine kinase